jgi:hypothetical protein
MTTRINADLAAQLATGAALATLLQGASIEFYTGALPADPSQAPTGTLIATVDAGGDPLTFVVSGGVVEKSPTQVWRLVVGASGVLGYARIVSGSVRIDSNDFVTLESLTEATSVELVAFSIYFPTEG